MSEAGEAAESVEGAIGIKEDPPKIDSRTLLHDP